MHLEIKPIHNDGLNCYEDLLISLAEYYDKKYQLAFSDSFGFQYLPEDPDYPDILGNRINAGCTEIYKLIKKYTGITDLENDAASAEKVMHIIKEQLSCGMPSRIAIDTFWCPWHGDYQNLHNMHSCLVIGINPDCSIICIDPAITANVCTLKYSYFESGYMGICSTFELTETPQSIDYKQILEKSIKKIVNSNIFNNIRLFSSDIYSEINFTKEFENMIINPWSVLLLRNLIYIAGSRYIYSKFVQHTAIELNDLKLLDFSLFLEQSRSNWDKVRSIFIKSYYAGFSNGVKNKVCKLLDEIASSEEKAFLDIVENINNNDVQSSINPESNGFSTNIIPNAKEFFYLDLKPFYNQVAFHSSAATDCFADFSGTGDYFISENVPSDQILEVGNMKFRFPEIFDNTFDNISCENQLIAVQKSYYDSIMFLGSSDIGSYIEYINLVFTNNESYEIKINFSDWWFDKLVYDEQIAWSGKVFNKNDNQLLARCYNLFAIQRSIPSNSMLESITLPNNSNIHIFAISLTSSIA